ncbi:MAG: MaoC family dehydratase [Burkholderiaceae bacterium]
MTVPVKDRYFEDYVAGEEIHFGSYEVTEEEIIEFASKYDPQYFHIDPQAARESHFGGLIASGWMTGSIMMRMMVDGFVAHKSSMGSPGLDEIRWLIPVRPGDKLRGKAIINSTRRSESKPDRGVINTTWEVFNQHDEVVMRVKGMGMYRTRS